MSTDTRIAGIYTRISDDRDGTELGVTRQKTDCEALVKQRGWVLGGVYTDNDTSAYSGRRRPEYERLVDDIKNGVIDAVVAWHPDRLHRSPRQLEDFIDLIDVTGAAVATVTAGEYDLATPTGRQTARIVGAVARGESEHKAERIRRKHRELAEAGKVNGGWPRAFGFEKGNLEVRESEAALIREAVAYLLAGGSIRGLCNEWNARGIKSVKGGTWHPHVMKRMVTSWRICGWRSHHDEPVAEAGWPPIVEREAVERLRFLLNDPLRLTRYSTRRYLLTGGIARCGLCDAPLVARPKADKQRCYVCATGAGFSGCGGIRVLAEPLEELVVGDLMRRLDTPELAAELRERTKKHDTLGLAKTIEDAEARLDQLARDFGAGDITRREWLSAKQAAQAKLDLARRQLGQETEVAVLDGVVGAGVLSAQWPDLSQDRRRAIMTAVVDRVTVGPAVRGRNFFDPTRVEITWRV